MTPEELGQERVKFEAWASTNGDDDLSLKQHPRLSNLYESIDTEMALIGWLAAKEDAKREIDELERELAEARKDAERYRWLRNSPDYDIWPPTKYPTYPWCVRGEIDHGIPASKFIAGGDLDAAIDAAIAKE